MLCLDVAVALMLVLTARAEPIAQLKATDYVNDFAHVLDQNAIAQMDEICRQIDEKAHAQIAVVTIKSLDGSDIESYAVDLFHQWGVGSKSTNRGVLILYAINDHRARIEVGYGLEPILPDGKVGGFQREAIPLMRAGNYSQALLLVTSRVATVIAQDAGVQLTTPQLAAGSGRAGRAAEPRYISRRRCPADCHCPDRSFYSASQHTFLDSLFWDVWRRGEGAEVGAAEVLAGVVVLVDLAAAVLVVAELAAAGSQRGRKWFLKKRLTTLSAGCEQRLERIWRA